MNETNLLNFSNTSETLRIYLVAIENIEKLITFTTSYISFQITYNITYLLIAFMVIFKTM